MARAKISKQPSSYPPLPFHLLRLGQLISAIVDSSILCFFTNHLLAENYSIPWTFLLLLTVSFVSLITLTITALYNSLFSPIRPRTFLILNAFLSSLWILGLSFLTWNLSWTLGHHCARSTWHNTAGIMVCRLYKALTAFVVTATACALASTVLDARVWREGQKRGKYGVMLDVKQHFGGNEADPWDASTGHTTAEEPVGGNGYEPARGGAGYGDTTDMHKPYHVQKTIEIGQFGYAAPSEQTMYNGGGSGRTHDPE